MCRLQPARNVRTLSDMRNTIQVLMVLTMAACSGGADDAPPDDVDAMPADGDASTDAIDTSCRGVPRHDDVRREICVAACSPSVPSSVCPGQTHEACVAECVTCVSDVAWCP